MIVLLYYMQKSYENFIINYMIEYANFLKIQQIYKCGYSNNILYEP